MEDQAEQYFNEGLEFAKSKNYSEAVTYFDRAIYIKPNYSEAWVNRGLSQIGLGQNVNALASIDKAIALNPNASNAWIIRGMALIQLKKNSEALESLDKAITIYPNFTKVWILRGEILTELGRDYDAITSYDRALSLNPNNADLWSNRGLLLLKQDKIPEALQSFDKALEIEPDNDVIQKNKQYAFQILDFLSWYNKGKNFYNFGDFESANISFKNALSLDPRNSEAWYLRGKCQILLLDFEEGITAFENAIKFNSENSDARKYRNSALEKREELKSQLGIINELYKENNYEDNSRNSPISQDYRVPILCANRFEININTRTIPLDQKEIIEWEYCCLLKSDATKYKSPNSDQEKAKLLFDKGFIYEYLEYYEEAIHTIDEGLKLSSKDENAWNNMGVALGKIGKISEAKLIFNEIISIYPKKIDSLLNLCWILNLCGDYEEVVRICDLTLGVESNNKTARNIKEITRINIAIRDRT